MSDQLPLAINPPSNVFDIDTKCYVFFPKDGGAEHWRDGNLLSKTSPAEWCDSDDMKKLARRIEYTRKRLEQPKQRRSKPEFQNRDRGKSYSHKMMASYHSVAWERIHRLDVFERDNWVCHICLRKIPKYLRYKTRKKGKKFNPLSASVDCRIAMNNGGGFIWENVQTTHYRCNLLKSDKVTIGQTQLLGLIPQKDQLTKD